MNIAVAGSHGLIGNNLVTFFRKSNNNVSRIVRSKEQNGIFWDPHTGYINHEKLENYDAIINLCGEKIASLNPFFKNRDKLIQSRVNTNLLLSATALFFPKGYTVIVLPDSGLSSSTKLL